MVRKPVALSAHGPTPDTCEAPVCNVEHKFELPDLVLLLPLFIFLFVTILLGLNRLFLLGFGVIWGRTDPGSLVHPKDSARGRARQQALGTQRQAGNTPPHPQGTHYPQEF